MLERIRRITRVKQLKFSSDELFERKKGYEEKDRRKTFSSIFKDEIQKKQKDIGDKPHKTNEAYSLEVGRPTQSLFYEGKADISNVQEKLTNAG